MTGRRVLTMAGLGLVVFGATACGGGGAGSGSLTREEWARRANAICADYLVQAKGLNPSGATSIEDARNRFEKLYPVLEDAVNGVRDLRPAADIKHLVNDFNTTSAETLRIAREVLNALRDGDAERVRKLSAENESIDRATDAIARQLGANTCAEDVYESAPHPPLA